MELNDSKKPNKQQSNTTTSSTTAAPHLLHHLHARSPHFFSSLGGATSPPSTTAAQLQQPRHVDASLAIGTGSETLIENVIHKSPMQVQQQQQAQAQTLAADLFKDDNSNNTQGEGPSCNSPNSNKQFKTAHDGADQQIMQNKQDAAGAGQSPGSLMRHATGSSIWMLPVSAGPPSETAQIWPFAGGGPFMRRFNYSEFQGGRVNPFPPSQHLGLGVSPESSNLGVLAALNAYSTIGLNMNSENPEQQHHQPQASDSEDGGETVMADNFCEREEGAVCRE